MRFYRTLVAGVLLGSMALTHTGCVTLFGAGYQTVVVNANNSKARIYHNDKEVGSNGKAQLRLRKRDCGAEFVVKSDSMKDRRGVTVLESKNPLRFANIPLYFLVLYPGMLATSMDIVSPKMYRYAPLVNIPAPVRKPYRKADEKYVMVSQASTSIKSGDVFMNFYMARKGNAMAAIPYQQYRYDDDETYSNTVFEDELNDLLHTYHYIDTTRKIMSNRNNTVYVEANIKQRYFESVVPRFNTEGKVMIKCRTVVEWKMLDYFKRPIFTHTSSASSDPFLVSGIYNKDSKSKINTVYYKATNDALTYALLDLQTQPEFQKAVSKQGEKESLDAFAKLETIRLPRSTRSADKQRMNEYLKSGVTIVSKDGHGSGFFISQDGYVVTNYHVVVNSEDKLEVLLSDGAKHKATISRFNDKLDLALLKIDLKDQTPLMIAEDEAEVGVDVWAIGTPRSIELGQTVSKGIISGIRRGEETYLQTDVAVNSGNSGGALITMDGIVRGVVTAKMRTAEGINFAIPAKNVLDGLKLSYGPTASASTPIPPVVTETIPAPAPVKTAKPEAMPVKAVKPVKKKK